MSTQASPQAKPASVRPFGMKDRIGYMFGDFGNDFTFILQVLFFSLFYVRVVGIDPIHVGNLLLVARILDAFTDVGVGRLVDILPPTKNGKFRPWILRGAIPVAVASALMYQSFVAGWDSYGARLAWMCVTYLIWGSITYTLINIPYGSMASVMTDRPEERAQLSVWRSTGANLAMLFLSVGMPLLVYVTDDSGQDVLDPQRMTLAAIGCSVAAVVCYLICYSLVRERVVLPPKKSGESMGLGKLLGTLFTSRALIGIVLAALLLLVGNLLISTMLGYVVLDIFNDRTLQSTASMAALLPTFVLIVVAPWLAKKFGKRESAVVSMLIGGGILIAMFLLNMQENKSGWLVMYALSQFMIAIFNFLVWSFIIDVIDAEELRTGERNDATIYAVYSWARKLGQALAGAVGNWALGWVGYQAGVQGGQAQETLDGIFMYSTLVPGVCLVAVALILQFVYPLSKKRVDENARMLAEKRAAAGLDVKEVPEA